MLEIRTRHNKLTLADMYSPKLGILPDLLTAHQKIDKIVWQAYGFIKKTKIIICDIYKHGKFCRIDENVPKINPGKN